MFERKTILYFGELLESSIPTFYCGPMDLRWGQQKFDTRIEQFIRRKKSYSGNMIKVSKNSYFIYRNYLVFFYCATNDKIILVFNRTSRCCYKRCVKLKIWFCDIGEVEEFCFFFSSFVHIYLHTLVHCFNISV